jgi:uncharacterized protein
MLPSKYIRIIPHPGRPGNLVLFSLKRLSLIVLPETLLPRMYDGSLTDEQSELLYRLGFLVENTSSEREEMLRFFDRINASRRRATMTILLNLDCNLACPYCYEGSGKGRHYLSPETAAAAVEHAVRRILPSKDSLQINFHGGEPLLSLRTLREVAEQLHLAANSAGKKFTFNLVTNGTLLNGKIAEELVPLGLSGVKITIDGPKRLHDLSRPFVSGKGSYDLIVGNLKEYAPLVNVHLGGNYTRESYLEFPRLLDDLLDDGITPAILRFVGFAPIASTFSEVSLPDSPPGCCTSDEPWLLEAVPFLREEIIRRGFDVPKPSHAICSIETHDDIVVSHDGSVYRCPGLVGRPEYRIGDILTGVFSDIESHCLGNWKTEECLDCCYLPFCFGGCRLLGAVKDGSMSGVDCRKAQFDATLDTIILQEILSGRA